jgi:hypothetical protein
MKKRKLKKATEKLPPQTEMQKRMAAIRKMRGKGRRKGKGHTVRSLRKDIKGMMGLLKQVARKSGVKIPRKAKKIAKRQIRRRRRR